MSFAKFAPKNAILPVVVAGFGFPLGFSHFGT